MKKGVFASAFLALLLMTNFVSAAFHYGFGGFGGGFVDWPTLVLNISIFFILFALINWSLARTRIFHGGTLTVLSLASAFITYYYAFYRTDFHINISRYFSDLLFNFGLSGDFIFPILSFIVIIILVLLARKIGLHGILIGLGLFLIGLASLTDIFYENFMAFIIGFILLFIGLWLWWKGRGSGRTRKRIEGEAYEEEAMREEKRMKKIRGSRELEAYKENARRQGRSRRQQAQQPQQAQPTTPSGIPILIKEAKKYRKWADKQQNPKMLRNWAHFINYLKRKGYGNSEKDISQRINVRPSDIQKIVKRHIL